MNKNMNDKEFDSMMKSYCTRKRQIAIDIELEQKSKSKKHISVMSVIASVLVIALAFGFVMFNPANYDVGTVPKGFSVAVSAAERDAVKLDSVDVQLCPKEEKGLGGDIKLENGMVSLEPIWFSMSGKDIETFDYKCENGLLYYVIPDLKIEMLEGNDKINQDDYFKKGKELKNIPYKSDTENYIFVSWFSLKLDDEAAKHYGKDIAEISETDMRNYRTEHLKNSDDFTYYFGDTITVTAHYKDGTQETAVIEVTVDTWDSDNTTYGNYVLKYR
ncbi:MAG: hypothetical protein Q4A12_07940 [Eubacteriales bacterium]|nr:hypothetical protein [Eubacteriales bacterium]